MDKKLLTIQDISCVGQCSLTVALPIISACGIETCILPSAVLSTHTGGFTGYTFTDLTEDMPKIANHWKKENIKFDALYTGYLGSINQINYVKDIKGNLLNENALCIVDPAMADNGNLYYGFDEAFVKEMASLCGEADIILPNITEACFMTGTEFKADNYDEKYIISLIEKLAGLGAKSIVLTGVGFESDTYGVAVYEGDIENVRYYFHEKISKSSHGTGDVYSSAFAGSLMRGVPIFDAAKIAADYTLSCIKKTVDDDSHWYGVKFEKAIPELVECLDKYN